MKQLLFRILSLIPHDAGPRPGGEAGRLSVSHFTHSEDRPMRLVAVGWSGHETSTPSPWSSRSSAIHAAPTRVLRVYRCSQNLYYLHGTGWYPLRTPFERKWWSGIARLWTGFEIQPAHVTSSACRYILGRDAESLPGLRRAEHHIGARTVISICMLSPPTAHTSVSATHDHILTSLLLAFRYLLAQAPIRS